MHIALLFLIALPFVLTLYEFIMYMYNGCACIGLAFYLLVALRTAWSVFIFCL